jgi:ribonuclease BN (tRNA processing enzyme)
VAREAKAGQLVVTHLMPGSVPEELRDAAARDYAGPITIGEDLLEV